MIVHVLLWTEIFLKRPPRTLLMRFSNEIEIVKLHGELKIVGIFYVSINLYALSTST